MIPVFDLTRQNKEIGDEIKEAIENVMASGNFVLGGKVEEFEKAFASYIGVKYAVGVSSGTAALFLSLKSIGVEGKEVITSANSASATGLAILQAGAKPVFVDVKENGCIDEGKIQVTENTGAILPVHIYGQVCDMDKIMDLGVPVVEDCCQSHGSTYGGNKKKVGSFGTGCFSFYPTKNLGCFGDGGMVTTNDNEIAEKLRLLRNYGWRQRYVSDTAGYNMRLDEVQGAILLVKLKYLDKWNDTRRQLAKIYDEVLGMGIEAESVYHLYVIRHERRDELKYYLEKNGVDTGIHYPVPLHKQAAMFTGQTLPVAEGLSRTVLSLPMFPELEEEEVKEVCEKINGF
jgi:hypothetical protein